jgi:hypothetical protein
VNHGPRTNAAAPSLLRRFFERAAAQTFRDLRLDDSPVQSYVAEILTRFARTEALYAVHQATSRRLTSVTDSLLAIEQTWDLDTPGFDPTGEISMRRHIGDYTLFMTGVFRERVEHVASTGYYVSQGTRAYRFVAEHGRATAHAAARNAGPLFARLAERFEQYSWALDYARRVHFYDAPPLPFFRLGWR